VGRNAIVAVYVVVLVVVVVCVDVVNIGIVVVFAAGYFWFLKGRLSA